jgi:phosphohistidine phosphatase
MKKLYLIRHAKSSWDNPELRDVDRPLNKRGLKDAPRMGERLKARKVHPGMMISSPAARARMTCQEIAKVLAFAADKIHIEKRLYHANEDQWLTVLRELEDLPSQKEITMMFGHNPGLTEFANRLLGETIDNIPTCGVVGAELNIKLWKEAAWGCGEMKFLDFPKK